MFIATNRLFVPEVQTDDFERQFTDNMRTFLPGVPGLRRSTLLRPTEPGQQPYVSFNEFDSREAFDDWVHSASFKSAHDRNRLMAQHIRHFSVETFGVTEDLALSG
jgi:heme-degrading monooxygenase HmoA